MDRNCNNCKKPYTADARNVKRGWGLCCSKSCAARLREKSKPGYNPERVAKNNIRRVLWNDTPAVSGYGQSQREIDKADRLEMELNDDGGWDAHQASTSRCQWCECLICRCED